MLTLLTPNGPLPIQAMLFDMDGTMADSRDFHMQAWMRLAERYSPGKDCEAIFQRTFGLTNRQIIPMVADEPLDLAQIDALSDEKEALYRQIARGRVRPVPGLEALAARALQAGVRLAVASSAPPENIDFILDEFQMGHYFAAAAHVGRVSRGKPDPETFLLAAQDLGARPSQCVVFEDAPAGLEAAKRAGMFAIAIETHPQPGLAEWADIIVPDFEGILPRLRGA